MTTIALLMGVFAIQDPPPSATRFADGSDARICGTVVSYKSEAGCNTTLILKANEERFEVFIPASIRSSAQIRPHQLTGGEVCASGRISLVPNANHTTPGRVILAVSSPTAIDITRPPAGEPFGGAALFMCEARVQAPRLISEEKPEYTAAAMRAKVQGVVALEAVVGPEGSVTAVRILNGLHPELDENAMRALKRWTFRPGTLDGKPVPVLVIVEMTFSVGDRR